VKMAPHGNFFGQFVLKIEPILNDHNFVPGRVFSFGKRLLRSARLALQPRLKFIENYVFEFRIRKNVEIFFRMKFRLPMLPSPLIRLAVSEATLVCRVWNRSLRGGRESTWNSGEGSL
jgi:hypothetical protein